MKRFPLALTIPAALILSGCSSSEPEYEYTASGDETTTAATTSDVLRATIVETSTAPVEQTTESMVDLPSELQLCRDLMEMMEQFPSSDDTDRRVSLTNLQAESAASEDWKSKSAEEQASINRVIDGAINGEC